MPRSWLRRVGVGQRSSIAGGEHNSAHVRVVTAVGGAGGEGFSPHFFIRQTMRANYRGCRIFAAEHLDVIHANELQIHNSHVSAVPGDGMAQLVDAADHIHDPEVVIKGLGQQFTGITVALRDDYTERFHQSRPLKGGGESARDISPNTSKLQVRPAGKGGTIIFLPKPESGPQARKARAEAFRSA